MTTVKPKAIRPAGHDPLRRGINMFLYANPGAGKTPLIASGDKTLIIDSDLGSASAAGTGADVWEDATTWEVLDEVYEFLRHTDHGYQWVWWDGVSLGQDRLLEDVMVELIKPVSQGGKGKSHRKTYLIDRGEYQENFMRIKQFVRHMQAQPFNFGITGFPAPSLDESSEVEKLWPWIQGRNMPQTVCSSFDIIAYGVREDEKFKMYVKETDEYYARDRFGALGAGLVNPTIPQIERRIKEKLGVRTSVAKSAAPVAKKATPKPVARRK